MSRATRITFAVLLLCAWSFTGCLAVIGHDALGVWSRRVIDVTSFGYAHGGSLTFKADGLSYHNITFYLCIDKQYEVLYAAQDEDDKLCSGTGVPYTICELNQQPLNEPIEGYQVKTTNYYHLLLVNCEAQSVSDPIIVDYTLVNPGNNQLSLGYIPLPDIYTAFLIVWFCIIVLSGLSWLRNKRHLVIFHGLMALVGLLKFLVVLVALAYWSSYKKEGKPVTHLLYLQSFLFSLSETAFFCALLLVSKGWRITRSTLPPSEVRTIAVALALLLSTLLFFSYYSDGYYFLSLMIMYFFMLPKIFTSITRNTRALQTQMLLMRYANSEASVAPLIAKINMFKTMRTAVILYLGSILLVSSMRIIMLWYLLWVNNCLSEAIALFMVTTVAILLRPRENGAFSTRAFLDGNPYPILNMQNLDHFDELFSDQLLDPDLVLMNAGLRDNALLDGSELDMNNIIVVEYPSPPIVNSAGKVVSYPRLAIGNASKPPPAENGNGSPNNKDNNNDNSNNNSNNNNDNNNNSLRESSEGSSGDISDLNSSSDVNISILAPPSPQQQPLPSFPRFSSYAPIPPSSPSASPQISSSSSRSPPSASTPYLG